MAGSFNLFRRYQKTALAALAIMAMLAFFILPPLLQMNAGGGSVANPVVMTWKGGTLREQDLDREVLTRRALNQFLTVLRAEATGDDQVRPPLAEGEQAVVRTLLLAREAESNGVVVSDDTVNDFLQQWTQNRITPAQIGGLIGQLRERVGFTEQTLFDAIRRLIMASEVRSLVEGGASLATMPPGWRWDAFCKLEQGATVEVIPVVAELLSDQVAEPKPAELRTLFAEYKDELPRARSATPGFREPARIRYDALVAPAERFVEEATKEVTDEAIATFYEENKERLFRAVDEPTPSPMRRSLPRATAANRPPRIRLKKALQRSHRPATRSRRRPVNRPSRPRLPRRMKMLPTVSHRPATPRRSRGRLFGRFLSGSRVMPQARRPRRRCRKPRWRVRMGPGR